VTPSPEPRFGRILLKLSGEALMGSLDYGTDGAEVDRRTLDWCIRLCRENPPWRLSVQQHKLWSVR